MLHEISEDGRAARYPKVKALIPIREAGELVFVSGHGPEDINTYEPLYRGRVGEELTPEARKSILKKYSENHRAVKQAIKHQF